MKKLLTLSLVALLTLTLAGCSTKEEPKEETNETVVVSVENGVEEMIDLEVPFDPERIVVVDYVALDMLDSWGLGNRVVGMPKSSAPEHLSEYTENEDIVNLGGLKEIDMEAIMELEPEIIFTSGRTASRYDEFSKIAPTVNTSNDYTNGFVESFETNVMRNAAIFGLEEKAEEQLAAFNERLDVLSEAAEGNTAIIAITSGGALNTLGNASRGNIITTDIGFENIATDVDTSHGNASSFEILLEKDADYVFILDRDTAIGSEGSTAAKQLLDNEIVHKTKAYKNDQIVYLTPEVWYLAEGGITSMDIMLSDLEAGILNK